MSRTNKTDLARSSRLIFRKSSHTEPATLTPNEAYGQVTRGGERFGNNRHMWAEVKVLMRRGERKLADREVVKEVNALYETSEPGCDGP